MGNIRKTWTAVGKKDNGAQRMGMMPEACSTCLQETFSDRKMILLADAASEIAHIVRALWTLWMSLDEHIFVGGKRVSMIVGNAPDRFQQSTISA